MNRETLQRHYEEHRPIRHYTCKKGWMNDPNGLIYHNGYYHLYYQYYPDGVTHGPMHWGHARTEDFLTWEELPVALYPDELGTIFSGCMVSDRNNTSGFGKEGIPPLVAVFTQNWEQEGSALQYQSLAYSLDGGITFQKYEKNPVLDLNLRDFRDPKVFWNGERQKWTMLLSAGQTICFFESDNLKEWAEVSKFTVKNMKPDEIWECPDLQRIPEESGNESWVLFVSQNTMDYSKTGIRYFIGEYDGERFVPRCEEQEELYLDFGRDNYAAATYADVEGRVIQQGWMNCWVYAAKLPEKGFRGSMTIPRELGIRRTQKGERVIQTPVRELRHPVEEYKAAKESRIVPIVKVPGWIKIVFEQNQGEVVFKNSTSQINIHVDFKYGKITVDRSRCGEPSFGPYFQETNCAYFDAKAPKVLEIFLDVTSLEIFAAGGEAAGTFQYFVKEPFDRFVF